MRTANDFKFRIWNSDDGVLIHGVVNPREYYYFPEFHRNWIVIQYTGIQDSEGADIYEGDILSVDWECNITQIMAVEYCATEGYPAFDLKGWVGGSNGLSEVSQCGHCVFKVIGNIYENPELLEDKS